MGTIDVGSTGFMLLSASLVMLMTPALAFFYGGLATKRNILGIMIQSFASLGWTTVLWFVFGYSLCFSGGEGAFFGIFIGFPERGFNEFCFCRKRKDPGNCIYRIPDDVCHHHSCPYHRSFCKPCYL